MKYEILPPAADSTVFIPGEAIVKAGFKDAPVLTVYAEENAVIVLKEKMTALELVETVNTLQDISAGLLLKAIKAAELVSDGFCCDDDCFCCEYEAECEAQNLPPCVMCSSGISDYSMPNPCCRKAVHTQMMRGHKESERVAEALYRLFKRSEM